MKTKFRILVLVLAIVFTCNSSFAQEEDTQTAPWVSGKGYWVLESNVKTPNNYIIRFYNNDNKLVYSEKISDIKLDISKRRTKMQLKKALENTLAALDSKEFMADKNYVASLFKKPR